MKKYQIVFLDWNNTLSTSKFWGHWQQGEFHPYYEKVQQQLFINNRHLLDPWMRGEYSSEEIIRKISSLVNINYQTLLGGLTKSSQQMKFVDKGVPSLIREIRRNGVKVIVASDNMDTFPRWTVPALKLPQLFDDILDSHTLRTMKKDVDARGRSKFFKRFFEKNNYPPSETVLIDDSKNDIGPVTNFGIDYWQIISDTSLVFYLQQLLRE